MLRWKKLGWCDSEEFTKGNNIVRCDAKFYEAYEFIYWLWSAHSQYQSSISFRRHQQLQSRRGTLQNLKYRKANEDKRVNLYSTYSAWYRRCREDLLDMESPSVKWERKTTSQGSCASVQLQETTNRQTELTYDIQRLFQSKCDNAK